MHHPSSSTSSKTLTPTQSGSSDVPVKNQSSVQYGFTLSPIHSIANSPASNESFTRSASNESPEQTKTSPVVSSSRLRLTNSSNNQKVLTAQSLEHNKPPIEQIADLNTSLSSGSPLSVSSSSTRTSDGGQDRFVPLAPIQSDHHAGSDKIKKVDAQRVDNIEPLGLEKVSSSKVAHSTSKHDTVSIQKSASLSSMKSSTDIQKSTSSSSAKSSAIQNDASIHSRLNDGSLLQSTSAHGDDLKSLTAVTEETNNSFSGDSGEMAELQSALSAAGLPQISSTQSPPPLKSTRASTNLSRESSVSQGRLATEMVSSLPNENLTYRKMDLHEIIRAIAAEELATTSKEILGGKYDQDTSPFHTADLTKQLHKEKVIPTDEELKSSQKTSKTTQKAKPSSAKEFQMSQTSKNSLSFRQRTPFSSAGRPGSKSGNKDQPNKKLQSLQQTNRPGSKMKRNPPNFSKTQSSQQDAWGSKPPSPVHRKKPIGIPHDVTSTCTQVMQVDSSDKIIQTDHMEDSNSIEVSVIIITIANTRISHSSPYNWSSKRERKKW